ncbi:ATP-binding protein [Salipaludibacillus sp. HK11]|uniref:ATP-binding protein n=1 Tax=Salipaludibacillus sp. HK11 TaxID=3394320 RepID=UPI0039FC5A20
MSIFNRVFFSLQDYENHIQGVRQKISTCLNEDLQIFDVAISEAIINGINYSQDGSLRVHGVYLKIRCLKRKMIVRVKTPGEEGFNGNDRIKAFKEKKEQMINQTLLDESGRGILIMVEASDYLIYNKLGDEVLLMKRKKNINTNV